MALPARSLSAILKHLRVRHLNAEEWRLAGFVLTLTIAAMAGLQLFNASVWPGLSPHPPFMAVKRLEAGQCYILALPFFVLNIVGEEFWWRGFIQAAGNDETLPR
jgi:membrane protease YdiL (CAAX protease family)